MITWPVCIGCLAGLIAATFAIANPRPSAPKSVAVVVDVAGFGSPDPVSASGALIGPDLLVTAYHVLDGARSAWVNLGDDGTRDVSSVLYCDRQLDVMLVKLESPVPFPVNTTIGSAAGFTTGFRLERKTASGEVVERQVESLDEGDYAVSVRFRFVTATEPGWSGAPILNRSGALVGIVTNGSSMGSMGSPLPDLAGRITSTGQLFASWVELEGGPKYKEYYALQSRAAASLHRGNMDEAKNSFSLALATNPTGFSALVGIRSLTNMDSESRLTLLRTAVSKEPDRQDLYALLVAEACSANVAEATQYVDRYVEKWGGPSARYLAAMLVGKRGMTEQSAIMLLDNLQRYPLHQSSAIVLRDMGAYTRSIERHAKGARALASARSDDVEALFVLGRCQILVNDMKGVAETVSRLKEQNSYWHARLERFAKNPQELKGSWATETNASR